MTKSTFAKTKAQIKSYQYYLFWGACTFAVMAGQIFVGAGYQSMSNSVKDLTELIEITKKYIVYIGDPQGEIIEQYKSMFGKISTPTKKLIL